MRGGTCTAEGVVAQEKGCLHSRGRGGAQQGKGVQERCGHRKGSLGVRGGDTLEGG